MEIPKEVKVHTDIDKILEQLKEAREILYNETVGLMYLSAYTFDLKYPQNGNGGNGNGKKK